MDILSLLIGLVLGFSIGFLYFKIKKGDGTIVDNALQTENARLEERIQQLQQVKTELEEKRNQLVKLNSELSEWKTRYVGLEEKLSTQKDELNEIQKKFNTEFENLANRILEDKSKKFTEQNKNNLDIILNPLKEKIKDFEAKVEKAYKEESTERTTLKTEIKHLIELNNKISTEANNLASALKGDNKMQGNWGEVILEKILESSGLIKGQEYKTQVSTNNEEGSRIQPDVVIYLPDNKHVIIDSKVSLIAYTESVNATEENEKARYVKAHIDSIKTHVKNLSDKNYQTAEGIISPDFVLMFIPTESSFSLAVRTDIELFNYSWEKKVVIVSPSTLLATVKTISSIWKQEKQTRNALEIAEQGGKLYDKFEGLVRDLIEVGKKMDAAKSNYSDAMNKLYTGKGNIVKSVENLKKLGAKASKDLPQQLIERSNEEDTNIISENKE